MIETLTNLNWAAVGQIIMIDILLGGDNAVVIALACRNLPESQRSKGIILGTIGAIVLRVLLIAFAVSLLALPTLKLIGGLLLAWIGIKLLLPEPDGTHEGLGGGTTLWAAVRTVIVADFVMSLDNVIGIAAAAERADSEHRMGLVIFGLLVSIPIIVWGSRFVIGMIERQPWLIWFGGGLLGWIAGGMIVGDQWFAERGWFAAPIWVWVGSIIGAFGVILTAVLLQRRSGDDATGQ
ncbi:MAG: TerC family protein [Burkholderiaceae bacterium]